MAKSRSMRRKKKLRFWRVFVLIILLIVLGGGSYFAYDILSNAKQATDDIYQELNPDKVATHREEEVQVTKDPFNVLLVGLETQEGGARSDVLMLVTVNPQTEEVYVLSIPRDTRLYIPEVGYKTKITHSYGNGGIETTVNAVQDLLDVPIDYYVTTNFDGFEDIVDTLGGVTVDVPFTFKAQLTESLKWKTFHEGEMELNGNEALAYVRMRKTDPKGDMGRNERQQQVIKEIVDKGTSFSSITKIDDIMDDLGNNVKTNIPPSKFVSFVKLYSQIRSTPIENLSIEGYDEYINDAYYYIPYEDSLAELSNTLNTALDISPPYQSSSDSSDTASEYNSQP